MLTLISHPLCPYVQRAAIALDEKQIAYERVNVDLANKPQWFLDVSPLGKTPVLKVDESAVFESAVIVEYLDEVFAPRLHPSQALARANHRGWIEFASALLNDIAGLYNAKQVAEFESKRQAIVQKWARVETTLAAQPFFAGEAFSLVDCAFGPVFRYFDVLDEIADFGFWDNKPSVCSWRATLAARPSVIAAVDADYGERLSAFLRGRNSHLSTLIVH